MFYVASTITFIVSLELLWMSTSLVRYELNSFRPPRVNHFGIREQLLSVYDRFIPFDQMVLYS